MITENATFGIADLSREFCITARAIRFYEDQGLLAPARAGRGGRTRVYSQRDRTRLELVLRGKRLGLSLGEIKGLLDMYETPADTIPQLTRFLELLDRHRQTLQQQVTDLGRLLGDIDRQRAEAQRLLAALQAAQPAKLTPSLRAAAAAAITDGVPS